jgi:hypothetical protein
MALQLAVDSTRYVIERLPHEDRWSSTGQFNHLYSAPHVAARFFGRFAVFASDQARE